MKLKKKWFKENERQRNGVQETEAEKERERQRVGWKGRHINKEKQRRMNGWIKKKGKHRPLFNIATHYDLICISIGWKKIILTKKHVSYYQEKYKSTTGNNNISFKSDIICKKRNYLQDGFVFNEVFIRSGVSLTIREQRQKMFFYGTLCCEARNPHKVEGF